MNCEEFWEDIDSENLSLQRKEHLSDCDVCNQDFLAEVMIEGWTGSESKKIFDAPESLWGKIEMEYFPSTRTEKKGGVIVWFQEVMAKPIFKPALVMILVLSFIAPGAVVFSVNHAYDLNSLTASTLRDLESAEQIYVDEIDKLSKIVGLESGAQTSPLFLLYNKKLDVLDGIIAECEEALLNNELNMNVRQHLLSAYKSKVDTLEAMSQLGMS
jgi:hypothetical protein